MTDHLAEMARALEHHMFKEEARLFPMTEQGGHALIGLLVDDLDAEHRRRRNRDRRRRAACAAYASRSLKNASVRSHASVAAAAS